MVAATALTGCELRTGDTAEQSPSVQWVTTTITVQPSGTSPPPTEEGPPTSPTISTGGGSLQVPTGGGIAITPVGRDGPARTAGSWTTGPAWSTSKIPLAIAALAVHPEQSDNVARAITASDNQAADALWQSLGPPDQAGPSVTAVLDQYGDPSVVPTTPLRPGFSVFGQTQWSLTDQAHTLAAMACDPATSPVRDLMGRIHTDQRWGLGQIEGASFKGGWGPSATGAGYLVRQVGYVPTTTGIIVVALALEGLTFEEATTRLDQWVAAISPELRNTPGGQCS